MVTALFRADFSSFSAAVDKAEVQLRDFQSGAGKVEVALNRMVDNFSGRKLLQDAALMERAIAEVGGVSALTGAQLQKAGVQASEALELMRKRGITVPPELQKIADKANSVTSNMSGMLGTVSKMAGAFGIAFSVGAVVGFGKSVLASADALVKMSDKTGIGTQGLQRFRVAGDDAGNTIEELSAATNKMQDNLVSGDKSFVSGMGKLNINLEKLRGLKPEDQFIAISDALRKITDPAEQVNVAIDVFGKTGAIVLPTLKRGFDDLKDHVVGMSDETVRKLDEAGDRVARWWQQFKAMSAEAAVATADFLSTIGSVDAREAAAKAGFPQPLPGAGPKGTDLVLPPVPQSTIVSIASYRDELAKAQRALGALTAADRLEIAAAQKLGAANAEIADKFKISEGALRLLNDQMRDGVAATTKAAKANEGMLASLRAIEAAVPASTFKVLSFADALGTIGTTPPQIRQLGMEFDVLTPAVNKTFLESKSLQGVLVAMPDATRNNTEAWAGFRNELEKTGAVSAAVGDALGRVQSILERKLVGSGGGGTAAGIASSLGSAAIGATKWGAAMSAAGVAGSVAMGAATMGIGLAAAAIWKLTRATEAMKVNDMRDDFVTMAGGLYQLDLRAQHAGLTLDRLLKTDNVRAYTREVERLKDAFDFQNSALEALADTEEKYHLSLDKASASLFREYNTLIAAGHGADTVLRAMQGSWQDLVDDAIKYGTVLPEAMRPMIERMIELGLLTDDNDVKLTDLTGINFGPAGDTFTDAFSRMNEGIDKLVAAIKISLGIALTDAEEKLLGIVHDLDTFQGRYEAWRDRMMGRGNAPADARANNMLTPGAVQRLGASAGRSGAITVNVQNTIQAWDGESVDRFLRDDGARRIAEGVAMELPGVLSRHGLIKAA